MNKSTNLVSLARNVHELELPNFIDYHQQSYDWFIKTGFRRLLDSFSPVRDGLGKMWSLEFADYRLGDPNRSPEEALDTDLTYDAPLFINVKLTNLKTGEIKNQEILFTDLPLLTEHGYFIINGVMRVVLHQIVRAEGVLFLDAASNQVSTVIPGVNEYVAKLIPERGTAYTFDINKMGVITVRLVRQRMKILATELLRAVLGLTNQEMIDMFKEVDQGKVKYIEATLAKDRTTNKDEAVMDIYTKLRPNETVTLDRAVRFVRGFFFNSRRFALGEVGRYQLNQKFGADHKRPILVEQDLVDIIKGLIQVNTNVVQADDPDSLRCRRIRSVGESLYRALQPAMVAFERNIKDRMSRLGTDQAVTPAMLLNSKVVTSEINSFFGMSQLSKFMSQENVFAAMEELSLVTAKGAGGLTGRSASYAARDLHFSHYSRICPMSTPDSASIGLNVHLAMYARINQYGFIEAPFRKLQNEVANSEKELVNRIVRTPITIGKKEIAKGTMITSAIAKSIVKGHKAKTVEVYPFLTDKIVYLSYHEESTQHMGSTSVDVDAHGNVLPGISVIRHATEFNNQSTENLTYLDVNAQQQQGIAFSMVPFAPSNDGKRVLMGTKTQSQAVPLLFPEAPLIATGTERAVAAQTGWVVYSPIEGEVAELDADHIVIKGTGKDKGKTFNKKIITFSRTNEETSNTQLPAVNLGDKVKKGDLVIDGPSMDNGELALGRNVLVAVMSWNGLNYDDSVVISERIVKEDIFTSVHIKMYDQDLRETKLGPEILTRDIPGVSEKLLRNLDDTGLVRPGAVVQGGDILAGIVAAKAAKQLSAEERLLMAVFGESAREVQNNSLRMPYGAQGIVLKTRVLSKENGDRLPPAVIRRVKVWVAELKKVSYGDKFTGYYGDKCTVSTILPVEDMPFLPDGTPVDMIVTPLFIKRMNIGQSKQMFYSTLAKKMGKRFIMPNFELLDMKWLEEESKKAEMHKAEKMTLFDGRTGEPFHNPVAVGWRYILRLKHIADEKMQARSTGPYSVVTQQPLGGKSHRGGQRLGEMEVRALQAHGAAHLLREMLTIKSDDTKGRSDAYRSIIQGEPIEISNVPASFNVLLKELNALGIRVNLLGGEAPKTLKSKIIPEE